MRSFTTTDAGATIATLPRALCSLALCLTVANCSGDDAEEGTRSLVRAAVAANFAAPHQELVRRFEAATGFTVETSLGSTGQLYAQIENGAPFDIYLAADSERPRRLEQARLGVAGTRSPTGWDAWHSMHRSGIRCVEAPPHSAHTASATSP